MNGNDWLTFKCLTETAIKPTYATDGSAAFDLYADTFAGKTQVEGEIAYYVLNPGDRVLVKTGIAIQLPTGTVGLVCPRSGLSLKHGITVLNAPGVIDSDYRDECGVILINLGKDLYTVRAGDRIAQMIVQPYLKMIFQNGDLNKTNRSGGFGSTGV